MSAPVALALVLTVVIPIGLVRAYRLSDAFVERWARARGLDLTAETRPVVASYLRSVRVMRTWGGVAGAVVPTLLELALTGRFQVLGFGADGEHAPLGFGTIFVGYLVGVLVAEVKLARPVGARRAASLSPRELEAYLPRRELLAERALAVVGAAVLLATAFLPYPPGTSDPEPLGVVAGAVAVLAFGAGIEAIERWLVLRPQPFNSPALVAADDAIRAQSIQAVAGAALALLLLFNCGLALVLQASEVGVLEDTMFVPAAILLILSLVACRDIGERAWRVRRPGGAAGPVSA